MLSHIDINKMNQLMEENETARAIIGQLLENHQTTVSTIAHEIRNPLTLVNSSLQIIELQHPEVKEFPSWKQTMEDVAFMCQLLNELSAFNNGGTLRYHVFSLNRLLKSTALSFAMSLPDGQIEFRSYIDPEIRDYTGDETKLHEVLLNLLKNAREAVSSKPADALPEPENEKEEESGSREIRKGHISLEARRLHNAVRITIQDDGCGIEPEILPDIFRAFYTTKQEGTGLGLALSKRIVESHNGRLTVRSKPGEGSTFTMTLPF